MSNFPYSENCKPVIDSFFVESQKIVGILPPYLLLNLTGNSKLMKGFENSFKPIDVILRMIRITGPTDVITGLLNCVIQSNGSFLQLVSSYN